MKRGSENQRRLDRWIGIPAVWVLSRMRRTRPMPAASTVKRIGVMTSTTIGDTLVASAALQQIHALWPGAELVFFAARGNRDAAAMLPGIDRIATISLTRPGAAIAAMRRERLDIMVDMTGWQRITAILALRSGARFVAGFSRHGQHRHVGFDLSAEHRNDRHESDNFASLAATLAQHSGQPLAAATPYLRAELLNAHLDPKWRGAVVFHCWATGGNRALREWPADRWQSLAEALRQRWPGTRVVLTAGPDDREQAEALAERLGAEVFPSAAGLPSVVPLLAQARLVVSVNTGIMHMAALIGAPVAGLSGPTADRRWGPRGPRAVGIDAPGADCGYLDLGWEWWLDPTHAGRPSCMESITVEQVLAALENLLSDLPKVISKTL